MDDSREPRARTQRLQAAISVTGVVIVLCVFGLIVHEMFPDAFRAVPEPARPRAVKEWNTVRSVGHRRGAAPAVVEIVEFTDFQCPACARMAGVLDRLAARYPGRVSLLVRHFPLTSIHPVAMPAAVASECAANARSFDAFYDRVFAQQDSLGWRSLASFAAASGVRDTATFNECVKGPAARQRVQRDVQAGLDLGLTGTPTLIVNGTLYPRSPSDAELERLIRDAR